MKNDLKKKLRARFVLLALAALLILESGIFALSALYSYRDMTKKADMMLDSIAKTPDSNARYFTVKVDPKNKTMKVSAPQSSGFDRDGCVRMAKLALSAESERGYCEDFRYLKIKEPDGLKIIFLYRGLSMESYRASVRSLAVFSAAGFAVAAVVLTLLSGAIVSPIVKNREKQKEFITSASHELKTPLTVISADAQLLGEEIGKNEWLDDIKKQVAHLTKMTENLVLLSRAEELSGSLPKEAFSVSQACEEALFGQRARIEADSKTLETDIEENVFLEGDEKAVRQLISVLLDNAVKYCPEKGEISFKLSKKRRDVIITVANTAENIDRAQIPSYKERFFRGRTSDGKPGSGLGLSIADAVAKQHNGALTVTSPDENTVRVECILR
ncbi:MAG: HAMP domain-containing histidine kinase [Clostridia bacterium]|nr:HAMP domain-containing histidine kinase [Clostridia bacterium]